MKWLIAFIFGCVHRKTTFPQTRNGRCYIVCLECGSELPYEAEWITSTSR
jgi:hypothetical protein